jgi:malonyl-CoA O-methyltransferase
MTLTAPHQFDRRAAQYEQHATVQRAAAAWLAEWLPDQIDHPALEFGAGTGLFTRHLMERTTHLVASDVAPRMVEAGRHAVPGAAWLVADAATPPDSDRYRWIFSCSLAQWLPDPLGAFRAWHRVAAPGARFVSGWFIGGTLAEFLASCPEASPFPWRDAAEWNDLLAQAGWMTKRQETKRFLRHYPDSAAMLREIHNLGAMVPRRMGAGKLRRILREYDRDHRDEDGVHATFEFLRVEATRL